MWSLVNSQDIRSCECSTKEKWDLKTLMSSHLFVDALELFLFWIIPGDSGVEVLWDMRLHVLHIFTFHLPAVFCWFHTLTMLDFTTHRPSC